MNGSPCLDRRTLLAAFFNDVEGAESLIEKTVDIVQIDPVLQKRSTLYMKNHLSLYLWYPFLINDSYEVTGDKFAWKYYRPQDGRTITFSDSKREAIGFATHELCLFDKNVLCYPYALSAKQKTTVVCGPVKEAWQLEELESLRDLGWTVRYLIDWELINDDGDYPYDYDDPKQKETIEEKEKPLLEELSILTDRCLIDKNSYCVMYGSEAERYAPGLTTLSIGTSEGIRVSLRGYDGLI